MAPLTPIDSFIRAHKDLLYGTGHSNGGSGGRASDPAPDTWWSNRECFLRYQWTNGAIPPHDKRRFELIAERDQQRYAHDLDVTIDRALFPRYHTYDTDMMHVCDMIHTQVYRARRELRDEVTATAYIKTSSNQLLQRTLAGDHQSVMTTMIQYIRYDHVITSLRAACAAM